MLTLCYCSGIFIISQIVDSIQLQEGEIITDLPASMPGVRGTESIVQPVF